MDLQMPLIKQSLSEILKNQCQRVESFCESYCKTLDAQVTAVGDKTLLDSMKYSLLGSGKRTRPALGLAVAESLGLPSERALPFVVAIEMIHSYSLIHDDLPAMDNDDFRRGRPTNHKVFGEAVALLAGDTLLTEAFGLVAKSYLGDPDKALKVISLLSEASGLQGMAGGQAVDLQSKAAQLSVEQILDLHARKTGALFRVICEGVGVLADASADQILRLRNFGAGIGLCFQLADDLIDSKDQIELGSLPAVIGLVETRRRLELESQRSLQLVDLISEKSETLKQILFWNLNRQS